MDLRTPTANLTWAMHWIKSWKISPINFNFYQEYRLIMFLDEIAMDFLLN